MSGEQTVFAQAVTQLEEAGFEVSLSGVTKPWALRWDKKGAHWRVVTHNAVAAEAHKFLAECAFQWLDARQRGTGEETLWADPLEA